MSAILLKVLKSLMLKLATEVFVKKVLIASAETLAEKTETDYDDKLVKAAKDALSTK